MRRKVMKPRFPHVKLSIKDTETAEQGIMFDKVLEALENSDVSAIDRKLFTEAWIRRTQNFLGLYREWITIRIRDLDSDITEEDSE